MSIKAIKICITKLQSGCRGQAGLRYNQLLCSHATSVLVLQEKILQQNFLEKCSEFTEQKNRLLKFIVVVSVLAFFLSIGITMYAVLQPESIPVLVTMNDFGETQYVGPVSRKTIKTLMFQNLTEKKSSYFTHNYIRYRK